MPDSLEGILEGLLFLWGDPLSLEDLSNICNTKKNDIKEALQSMEEKMKEKDRGLILKYYEDKVQLVTKPILNDYASKLVDKKKPNKLSNSSMETLAIIAYRQPVTRIEIEQIRGVKSTSSIETLLKYGLIEEKGRLDQIGKPILYGTSLAFLQQFDLTSIQDLPEYLDLKWKRNELQDENQ